MIRIENLTKRFGKLQVMDNINLVCNKGECIALIGPNGCGKTTLIKCILGMVVPNSGKIFFDEQVVKNTDYKYRNRIGYMPQIGRYPDNMNIEQVVEMIRALRKSHEEYDEELLENFKLKSMYGKKMRTLSGGTTQKVSATLSFLFNPDVLILDEPTAGLDPLAAEMLKEKIIKEKEKGKLILITSHLLSELDGLVTQVIFMQEGKVVFHKGVAELKEMTGQGKLSKAILSVIKNQASE